MDTVLVSYNTAIICAALVLILAMLESIVGAGIKFGPGKGVAGIPVGDSHDSLPFRMERAHLNIVENIGLFTLALGLAIPVGVDPSWVNWIAILFLVSRTGHWIMYAAGISPLRTSWDLFN
jgi:uncharacterized MAPEG superfamily protein